MKDIVVSKGIISRKNALGLIGLVGLGTLFGYGSSELKKLRLHLENPTTQDIEIPRKQAEKFLQVDEHLKSLTQNIRRQEGGPVPDLIPDNLYMLYFTHRVMVYPETRSFFITNPQDCQSWITGRGDYKYDFVADKPEITGGIPKWRNQAREIFNDYFGHDQFRVKDIRLTDHNRVDDNRVQWEAGKSYYQDPGKPLSWIVYRNLVHEISHAGTPLNGLKDGNGKNILLPYGLDNTLNFHLSWLEAMNKEYPYFHSRFFTAPGDETLGLIRQGDLHFNRALSEIIAMCCTDYVFPTPDNELGKIVLNGDEPLEEFPLTHKAIRQSIAYIHYGISAQKEFPEGIAKRDRYIPGTFSGDLYWKIHRITNS